MTTYVVIRKADGEAVYTYVHDAVTATEVYPLDLYDHVPQPDAPFVPGPSTAVFGGIRHLTKLEFRKLLKPAEEIAIDLIRAKFDAPDFVFNGITFTDAQRNSIRVINNKYQEATFIDLDDEANRNGLTFFAQIGALESIDRVQEILNG